MKKLLQIVKKHETRVLTTLYPNKSIGIYVCRDIHFHKALALSYLLDRQGLNSRTPEVKLALRAGECPMPRQAGIFHKNKLKEQQTLEAKYKITKPFDGLDFSTASPAAVRDAGWSTITIDDIYANEVRWYFKEQP